MATLTAAQLGRIRRDLERHWTGPITYSKGQMDATIQSLEDWMETHTGLFAAMNTASDPITFSVPEKNKIMRHYFRHKNIQGMG